MAKAIKALWFETRCWLCEVLTGWALRVGPEGYVCGMVQASVDSYRRGQAESKYTAPFLSDMGPP